MEAPFFVRCANALRWFALGSVALLASSCATASAECPRAIYRLVWTATRSADQSPLASVSTRIAANQSTRVRTDSIQATESKPAFPLFTAELSRTRTPGVFELVTRTSLREASRNKKGKLKIRKRNIGALVPIKPGEPAQLISEASDPVRLEVRLERR